MERRRRRPLKVAALTVIVLLLALSMVKWYYLNRSLAIRTLRLPERISWTSWPDISPPAPASRPQSESQVSNVAQVAPTGSGVESPSATSLPPIDVTAIITNVSVPLFPNPEPTVEGVQEELIKPSVDVDVVEASASIGKITIVFGGDNPTYERALKTHEVHNRLHRYPTYVLRQQILNDVWTKPAYILSVLLKELAKPADERLHWLFWFDADTVLMNPNIPLELFLPPDEFGHVHLLVTNDYNGLNNGVFPIRVHPWSVALMSAVVAFTTYRPEFELKFRDQSALDEMLKEDRFRHNVAYLPQRWFNAYQSGSLKETAMSYQLRRGDLSVHFAGLPDRDQAMTHWLELAEKHLPEWELDLYHSSYPGEIREFWAEKHAEAEAAREQSRRAMTTASDLIQATDVQLHTFQSQLSEEDTQRIRSRLDTLRQTMTAPNQMAEPIYKSIDALQEARSSLRRLFEQAKRETVRAAYVAIFEASNELAKITDPTFDVEVEAVRQLIDHVRSLVVEKADDTEMIRSQTQALQQASVTLVTKVRSIEEASNRSNHPHDEPMANQDIDHVPHPVVPTLPVDPSPPPVLTN